MTQKLIALIVLVMVVLLSVAGCTSPTSSYQAANNTSQAASTTANATTSASTSASVSPSVTPSADVYQVVVSGPTDSQYGSMWTATVYKNGVVIPCDQLTGQVSWYINGQPSIGGTFGGSQCTMTHDANGLAGSPFQRTNTITATYQGVTSSPVLYGYGDWTASNSNAYARTSNCSSIDFEQASRCSSRFYSDYTIPSV